MIVADKKLLEANLAKGTTQSALIATIGLVGFQQGNSYPIPSHIGEVIAQLLLFVGLNIGTIASFVAYTQCAVAVVWGPIMGLSGEHQSEVLEATRHMLIQKNDSIVWGAFAILAIVSTPFFYILLLVDWKCALPCGIACLIGYYLIWTEGSKAYHLFDHEQTWRDLDDELYRDFHESTIGANKASTSNTKSVLNAATTFFNGSVSTLSQKEDERDAWFKDQKQKILERIESLSARGVIWVKPFYHSTSNPSNLPSPLRVVETSNCFRKMFLDIHNGTLDIYNSDEDFKSHNNPINPEPINLAEFNLEIDLHKIMQHTHLHLSLSSSLRSAVTGTQEISFRDSLNADFDVAVATKRFRFSLVPKTFSELISRESIHFMAEEMIPYKQWVSVIKDINIATSDLEKLEILESQMKGSTNVVQAVSAANQVKL